MGNLDHRIEKSGDYKEIAPRRRRGFYGPLTLAFFLAVADAVWISQKWPARFFSWQEAGVLVAIFALLALSAFRLWKPRS